MSTATQLMTAEDLLKMPDDGFRYELVRGEIKKMAPAGHSYGRIVMNISTPLDQYVRANGLGVVYAAETGFILSSNPDLVRAPVVAFVRQERVREVGNVEGYWPGAPDVAIEVISPYDAYTEVEEKVFDWLEAGAHLVIVVNPRKRVVTIYGSLTEITVLTENDVLDGGNIIRGWSLPVNEIFT